MPTQRSAQAMQLTIDGWLGEAITEEARGRGLTPEALAHGIAHILTFDVEHFARFAAFGPGLAVIDPATV